MPRSFRTSEQFRAWLEKNHATARELIVRCFKIAARHRGIGYKEALDEALCFGWIDGVRRALDEDSFTVRFSPRKTVSKWSRVNIQRATELEAEGRMHDAGVAAFRARGAIAVGPYSYESQGIAFDASTEKAFRASAKAWKFFQAQPPGYRRLCTFWIMTAKREETRARRLAKLIDYCERGVRIEPMGKANSTNS